MSDPLLLHPETIKYDRPLVNLAPKTVSDVNMWLPYEDRVWKKSVSIKQFNYWNHAYGGSSGPNWSGSLQILSTKPDPSILWTFNSVIENLFRVTQIRADHSPIHFRNRTSCYLWNHQLSSEKRSRLGHNWQRNGTSHAREGISWKVCLGCENKSR